MCGQTHTGPRLRRRPARQGRCSDQVTGTMTSTYPNARRCCSEQDAGARCRWPGEQSLEDPVGGPPSGPCCRRGQQLLPLPADSLLPAPPANSPGCWTGRLGNNRALLSFLNINLHLEWALLRDWTSHRQYRDHSYGIVRPHPQDHLLNSRLMKSTKIKVSHRGPVLGDVRGVC